MKRFLPIGHSFSAFLFLLFACPGFGWAQDADRLPRSRPEAEGVSSRQISIFLDSVGRHSNEMHSLMVLRHGKVVAEGWWKPYGPDLRHTLYSCSKSFTSTAVGLAVTEGRLHLTDRVSDYFRQDLPENPSPFLLALTVRDLLTMSVGQKPDPTSASMKSPNWARFFLSQPIVDTPGKVFLYNSMATYMLSALVQKVTGQKVFDYLKPRLFDPLGIHGIDWETSPQGVNTGGWGLRVKTEDMAKFGQLYLQKGRWKGKQLLPAPWVEEATSYKIDPAPKISDSKRDSSDWAQGYCYQFWRCRHHAFRADGAFGQYVIVLPELDAVVAITSETADMQDILNLVWDELLPAFSPKPLPEDPKSSVLLQKRLKSLEIPAPVSDAEKLSPGEEKAGKSAFSSHPFGLQANENHWTGLNFTFDSAICHLHLETQEGSYSLSFGQGRWVTGTQRLPERSISLISGAWGPFFDLGPSHYGFSYRFVDKKTLELTLRYTESPHHLTYTFRLDGDHLVITQDGSLRKLMHLKPVELEAQRVNWP